MKGGINFEEWKEIVKKNRRSLRSKSNSFKFEPESLTYGAEKAVKSPEYGQVHTITYNITGVDTPSSWPTEIKSGKTINLSIPEGYEMVELSIDGTTLDNYEYENGVITVNNVQHDLHVELTVSPPINTNGHEYVDLGLPSGTLWATMNVGASSPTEYGNYYMYGMGSKTYDSTDTPYAGTEDPLDLSKDTARQTWGGDWHMPTEEQMQELIDNTTQEWTDSFGPGVAGVAFTGTNGNVIFMPACGYYENNTLQGTADYGNVWSSNCFEDSNNANLLYFFVDGSGQTQCYTTNEYRYYGYSVRPVIG